MLSDQKISDVAKFSDEKLLASTGNQKVSCDIDGHQKSRHNTY